MLTNFLTLPTTKALQTFSTAVKKRGCRAVLCVAACALLLSGSLVQAQVATGDILGTVTDIAGSAVVGATIRVENVGTHQVRTFTTKGSGEYVFSTLQPGTYQVTVTSPTFKTFSATNVVLAASDRVRIDAPLQVGSMDERVEVTAIPTSLQTDSTTVGSTITEKTLLDAPLNGRNYIGLVQVQAGVNAGSPNSLSSGSNIVDRRQSSSISANGQEELFNNNMLDGLDNNSRAIGTLLLRPSVEAIAQVRTDINLYTAEVGRTGGAAINVISKSGDNKLHGSAYEFFRNDITDARNYFAPASLLSHKPEQRQNQYGASLGGPIFRDRTFFFIDYEGLRLINGNNSVYLSTVPTAAEQTNPGFLGDIINPFTRAPVANITTPLDPTGLAYFKLFPLPNLPGAVNNFLYNPSASLYSSLGDVRIDHHFGLKDTLFGRYSYNRTQAYTPPYLPAANGVQPGGIVAGTLPGNNFTTAHNGQFGYTHVFTPSLLLELRAGYTYFNLDTTPLNFGRNLNDTAPYLIPNANECNVCSGLATLSLVGLAGLGDAISQPFYDQEHNTQFAGALTYTRGRHTFKTGAALIRRNFSFQLPIYPKGLFIFAPTAVAATATYVPTLQKLLTGTGYVTMRQAFNAKPYDRTYEPSVYFQDDWRVTDKLTLNLGLRYDVYTTPNEKNGNFANFQLNTLSVIQNATGGLQTSYKDFSPRFGFDATIAPGTVLRGGFGLTFFPSDSNNSLVLNVPPFGFNSGTVFHPGPLSVQGVGPVTAQGTTPATLYGALTTKPTKPDGQLPRTVQSSFAKGISRHSHHGGLRWRTRAAYRKLGRYQHRPAGPARARCRRDRAAGLSLYRAVAECHCGECPGQLRCDELQLFAGVGGTPHGEGPDGQCQLHLPARARRRPPSVQRRRPWLEQLWTAAVQGQHSRLWQLAAGHRATLCRLLQLRHSDRQVGFVAL